MQENIPLQVIPMPENGTPFIPPKSRQLQALVMKTLATQKRSVFNNVCCILLCPLVMVYLCAILGTVILGLIQRTNSPIEILYCSNMNASDPTFQAPILNSTFLPSMSSNGYARAGATADLLYYANYFLLRPLTVANPGAATLSARQPCEFY